MNWTTELSAQLRALDDCSAQLQKQVQTLRKAIERMGKLLNHEQQAQMAEDRELAATLCAQRVEVPDRSLCYSAEQLQGSGVHCADCGTYFFRGFLRNCDARPRCGQCYVLWGHGEKGEAA